jgi:hypothetical protein
MGASYPFEISDFRSQISKKGNVDIEVGGTEKAKMMSLPATAIP